MLLKNLHLAQFQKLQGFAEKRPTFLDPGRLGKAFLPVNTNLENNTDVFSNVTTSTQFNNERIESAKKIDVNLSQILKEVKEDVTNVTKTVLLSPVTATAKTIDVGLTATTKVLDVAAATAIAPVKLAGSVAVVGAGYLGEAAILPAKVTKATNDKIQNTLSFASKSKPAVKKAA